jgi:hypothetical protein
VEKGRRGGTRGLGRNVPQSPTGCHRAFAQWGSPARQHRAKTRPGTEHTLLGSGSYPPATPPPCSRPIPSPGPAEPRCSPPVSPPSSLSISECCSASWLLSSSSESNDCPHTEQTFGVAGVSTFPLIFALPVPGRIPGLRRNLPRLVYPCHRFRSAIPNDGGREGAGRSPRGHLRTFDWVRLPFGQQAIRERAGPLVRKPLTAPRDGTIARSDLARVRGRTFLQRIAAGIRLERRRHPACVRGAWVGHPVAKSASASAVVAGRPQVPPRGCGWASAAADAGFCVSPHERAGQQRGSPREA